jgi:uncharacterized protein YdcH (DUF465 family)
MLIFHFTNVRGSRMKEAEIISILRTENDEFRKLEKEHKKLDTYLDEIARKKYLTSDEEIEKKKIQKKKLQFKDRMAQLIRDYKN